MIPEKTTVLTQTSFFRGCQKFEILPDGNLEYTFKRFSLYRQFKIPLWQINPSSQRLKVNPSGSYIGAIFFGIVLFGFAICALVVRDKGAALAMLVPITMFGVIFAACVWNILTSRVNCVLFVIGPSSQLRLWFNEPEPVVFGSFCKTLTTAAEDAQKNKPLNTSALSPQKLAEEIRELQKLRESKVLSDEEFERAKAKLLGIRGSIGFK